MPRPVRRHGEGTLPRNRTGLRNRSRRGVSSYSEQNKSNRADRYGTFSNGVRISPDILVRWSEPHAG